jgi:hypothetical protein
MCNERRVGVGSYLSIPGGDVHVSSGDPKEGALFCEESPGKFDSKVVDQKGKKQLIRFGCKSRVRRRPRNEPHARLIERSTQTRVRVAGAVTVNVKLTAGDR